MELTDSFAKEAKVPGKAIVFGDECAATYKTVHGFLNSEVDVEEYLCDSGASNSEGGNGSLISISIDWDSLNYSNSVIELELKSGYVFTLENEFLRISLGEDVICSENI